MFFSAAVWVVIDEYDTAPAESLLTVVNAEIGVISFTDTVTDPSKSEVGVMTNPPLPVVFGPLVKVAVDAVDTTADPSETSTDPAVRDAIVTTT